MANKLTWLHLSDLHMQRDTLDSISVSLDALWKDIPRQVSKMGGKLDFIAFTGDIAFSGKADEYKLADEHFFKPLLNVTKLSRDFFFIVPGNHDLDWGKQKIINQNFIDSFSNEDDITAVLDDNNLRNKLFKPMNEYAKFIKRFLDGSSKHPSYIDPCYSFGGAINVGTLQVVIIGANSAWASGYKKDKGKVSDYGNLMIGDKQIRDVLKKYSESQLKIILKHHSSSWLKEFDRQEIDRTLRAGCDFVLRGHLHEPDFIQEQALGGKTIHIPAGAIYQRNGWLCGYNLVQLDFDRGEGLILLRRYSPQKREWVNDNQSTGDELKGTVKFELPGVFRRKHSYSTLLKGPAKSQNPESEAYKGVKVNPPWALMGREREVQLVTSFLKQENKDVLWVGGPEGCGHREFLQVIIAIIKSSGNSILYFDGEDIANGIVTDQNYFTSRFGKWILNESHKPLADHDPKNKHRLDYFLDVSTEHMQGSHKKLIFVFANYHMFLPTIREWCYTSFWGRIKERLGTKNVKAFFSCPDINANFPFSEKPNKIILGDFTINDVKNYLSGIRDIKAEDIDTIALTIHSEGTNELFASPKQVYQRLFTEAIRHGWFEP